MIEQHPIPAGMRLHPLRARYLTASDIGAAAGHSRFKTPLALHLEKLGRGTQVAESPVMRFGRLAEPAVIGYLEEEYPGRRFIRPNLFLADDEHRLGATPDALTEDPDETRVVNIQIKVVGMRSFTEWGDVPPPDYRLQVACENMLLDAAYGVLAVLVNGHEPFLQLYEIKRDPTMEAEILDIARLFWHRIDNGIMPQADYRRDGALIAAMYPTGDPEIPPLDLSGDNELPGLLDERAGLKAAQKAADERCTEIEARIKNRLGDATRASLPGWRLLWKEEHRKAFEVAAKTTRPLRIYPEEKTS